MKALHNSLIGSFFTQQLIQLMASFVQMKYGDAASQYYYEGLNKNIWNNLDWGKHLTNAKEISQSTTEP